MTTTTRTVPPAPDTPRRVLHRIGRTARRAIAAMTPMGRGAAAVSAACAAAYAFTGWAELLAVTLTLMTLLACGVAQAHGSTGCRAELAANPLRATVGGTITVSVTVTNTGTAAIPSLRIELPIGATRRRLDIARLPSGRSTERRITIAATRRAEVPVGPLTVCRGDPFGLIRHERHAADGMVAYVHPEIVPLDGMARAGTGRDPEGCAHRRIVDDDFDIHGLRAYRPGDDVRRVHWLASARTRTLMVRQYEAAQRMSVVIDFDTNPDHYRNMREFELAVCVVASIGVHCLRWGMPLSASAGGASLTPRSATDFLDWCSGLATVPDVDAPTAHGVMDESRCRYHVIGSLANVRSGTRTPSGRSALAAPPSDRPVLAAPPSMHTVIRVADGASPDVRRLPRCTLVTIGILAQLPIITETAP